MTTENLSMLAAAADIVGRESAAADAARADVLTQRALMLQEVIAALKGAWRAMSSRVGLGSTMSPAGITTDYAPWTGLYLAGDGPKGAQGAGASRGRYSGTRLFLRGYDGALVELAYDGPWSKVPGEVSSWRATERLPNLVEVVGAYDLTQILDALTHALEAQKDGHTPERAAQWRAEADRIKAARSLLRSSR